MSNSQEIDYGWHDAFFWLWASNGSLATLLSACPGLVQGHPILVTDHHGSPPVPGKEERAKGWRGLKGAAFHPCLPEAEDLIWSDVCEFYVLSDGCDPKVPTSCFNEAPFNLRDPEAAFPFEETWDPRGIKQRRQELLARQTDFWRVMRDLRADSYVGEGSVSDFTFVTCRREHLEALVKVLTATASA